LVEAGGKRCYPLKEISLQGLASEQSETFLHLRCLSAKVCSVVKRQRSQNLILTKFWVQTRF